MQSFFPWRQKQGNSLPRLFVFYFLFMKRAKGIEILLTPSAGFPVKERRSELINQGQKIKEKRGDNKNYCTPEPKEKREKLWHSRPNFPFYLKKSLRWRKENCCGRNPEFSPHEGKKNLFFLRLSFPIRKTRIRKRAHISPPSSPPPPLFSAHQSLQAQLGARGGGGGGRSGNEMFH